MERAIGVDHNAERASMPDAKATAKPAARIRTRLLWLLCIEALVMACVVWWNWELLAWPYTERITRRIEARNKEQQFARYMRNDPPVGKPVPMIGRLGLQGAGDAKFTVVAFSTGASCCTGKVAEALRAVEQAGVGVVVVMVVRDSSESVKAFKKVHHVSFQVLADPDGSLAQACNAFWMPRAYLLDREGRLVWIQQRENVDLKAEVPRLVRRRSR